MNINQETPMPPPYNIKNNDLLPNEYYRQAQYSSPPVQQAQPLYVGNPMMVVSGDHPMALNCPHCHQSIVTRVEKNNGLLVWLAAGGLCVFGFFCGCCLIPFCINELKDTTHYCPNCNRVLGQSKKL